MRATSRETAANTPAETATLQGEGEEDGADSDAGSSHGDPDAEALGRESNDECEIDAQVRVNLESENATLLKRVKASGRAQHHRRPNATVEHSIIPA